MLNTPGGSFELIITWLLEEISGMPNSAPSFMDTDLPLKWKVNLVDLPDEAVSYLSPEAIDLNEDRIDVSFSAQEPLLLTKVEGKA